MKRWIGLRRPPKIHGVLKYCRFTGRFITDEELQGLAADRKHVSDVEACDCVKQDAGAMFLALRFRKWGRSIITAQV